jgi:putative flavoprotein involved in K+ transport
MLEKLAPSAEQTATQWVRAFDRALADGDGSALRKRFLPDSHWRNLFAISWQFATFSGNAMLCHELSRRASEVRASGFRLDTAALAPRRVMVAGCEVVEAIICFDTTNGPGIGAIRLICPPARFPRCLDDVDVARLQPDLRRAIEK